MSLRFLQDPTECKKNGLFLQECSSLTRYSCKMVSTGIQGANLLANKKNFYGEN